MNIEFRNYLTLKTVPSKMSKLELICSVLTWILALEFITIIFIFFSKISTNNNFITAMICWLITLTMAVIVSFIIDKKNRMINAGSILWLAFLVYMVISIVGKL